MAAVWRQEDRETQDPDLQMHIESSIQRGILLQCTMGEDQRMLFGCDGDGFRQHWTKWTDRTDSARRYLESFLTKPVLEFTLYVYQWCLHLKQRKNSETNINLLTNIFLLIIVNNLKKNIKYLNYIIFLSCKYLLNLSYVWMSLDYPEFQCN